MLGRETTSCFPPEGDRKCDASVSVFSGAVRSRRHGTEPSRAVAPPPHHVPGELDLAGPAIT